MVLDIGDRSPKNLWGWYSASWGLIFLSIHEGGGGGGMGVILSPFESYGR